MKNKPSIAGTPDSTGRRPSDGERARRVALFAALCLLATESMAPILLGLDSDRLRRDAENLPMSALDELTLEGLGELLPLAVNWLSVPPSLDVAHPSQFRPLGETTDSREAGLVDAFLAADNVGSSVGTSSPATVAGTADASADEAPTLAVNMIAAVYPPMLLGATPRSGLPKDAPEIDGRKSIPLSLEKRVALGSAVRADHERSQQEQASPDAAGLPLVNSLGDYSGLATQTPGSPMEPHTPGVRHGLKDLVVGAPLADHPGLAAHGTPGPATGPHSPGVLDALNDSAAGDAGNPLAVENIVLAAASRKDVVTATPQATQQLAPFRFAATAVPEPTTVALLAFGFVGLGFSLRRR